MPTRRGKAAPRPSAAPVTPPPVPADAGVVVVFGGSFDPPHFYHTIAPLALTMRLFGKAAWLLYVPAARSPLKPTGPIASDAQRIAMLKLALDIPGRRSIWTDEIDRARWQRRRGREDPSYTVDTLRRLRSQLPKRVKLRLLIGSDQAAQFHRWKDCREIIRLAEPLVMAREGIETVNQLYQSLPSDFWTLRERAAWCRRMAPNFPMPASSTFIRERIPSAPRDPEQWGHVICPVAAYIIRHHLYGYGTRRPRPWRKPLKEPERTQARVLGQMLNTAAHRSDPGAFPRKAVTKLTR